MNHTGRSTVGWHLRTPPLGVALDTPLSGRSPEITRHWCVMIGLAERFMVVNDKERVCVCICSHLAFFALLFIVLFVPLLLGYRASLL